MKKLLCIALCVMMLLSSICASANTDFLKEVYGNYTGKYTTKISFESGEEIVKLLKSVNLLDTAEKFVDVKSLFETLLTFDSKFILETDLSDDMKKMSLALTMDSTHKVNVNKNLKVNVDAKTGMWLNMDISDVKNPVMKVIYSYPYTNKYMVLDAFELMSEEEKSEITGFLSAILNKGTVAAINAYSAELINQYADIKTSAGKTVIKIDNKALCSMIGEIIPYIIGQINTFSLASGNKDVLGIKDILDGFSFESLNLLGKDGITYTYSFKGGKISTVKQEADICIDIAQIYTALTGTKWTYSDNGKLKFKMVSDASLSDIGKTSPVFPILTSENSFSITELLPKNELSGDVDEKNIYPELWTGGNAEKLPEVNGEIYVPLRQVLENAYGDTVLISFENGAVKAESEYFPKFKIIKLVPYENKVYTDSNGEAIYGVFIENGTTYVTSRIFTDLFGWNFSQATYDMLANEYYYGFYTQE